MDLEVCNKPALPTGRSTDGFHLVPCFTKEAHAEAGNILCLQQESPETYGLCGWLLHLLAMELAADAVHILCVPEEWDWYSGWLLSYSQAPGTRCHVCHLGTFKVSATDALMRCVEDHVFVDKCDHEHMCCGVTAALWC
jgi:hypothetical protein